MRKILAVSLCLNLLLASGYLLLLREGPVQALANAGSGGGVAPSGNGDVNCDGALDISDAVWILSFLFLGGAPPCTCQCSTPAVCGNGTVEPSEGCDDGNTLDGDGCSSTCQVESACGDGVVSGGEECDGGDFGGRTCEDFGFSGGFLVCNNCKISTSQCISSVCGNFLVEPGETCDDGNTANGDGCSATCQVESGCGDGVISGLEQCDGQDFGGRTCQSLGFTGGSLACNGNCDIDTSGCFSVICGDGIVNGQEGCDDSNTVNGDGCDSTCRVEAGFICTGSPSTCGTICGDFIVAGGEECDDGNTADGDGCSSSCRREQ